MNHDAVKSLLAHHSDINSFQGPATVIRFRVGVLTTPVTARIWPNPEVPGGYEFEVSHRISTPTQGGPYSTSVPCASSIEEAVARVISGLLGFYDGAVRAGHTPTESWLSPSPSWRDDPFA